LLIHPIPRILPSISLVKPNTNWGNTTKKCPKQFCSWLYEYMKSRSKTTTKHERGPSQLAYHISYPPPTCGQVPPSSCCHSSFSQVKKHSLLRRQRLCAHMKEVDKYFRTCVSTMPSSLSDRSLPRDLAVVARLG
jgi:hypothetical protein